MDTIVNIIQLATPFILLACTAAVVPLVNTVIDHSVQLSVLQSEIRYLQKQLDRCNTK